MRLRYRLILSFLMLALIPLLLINTQANLAMNRLSKLRNDQIRLVVDAAGDRTTVISGADLTKMLNVDQVNYDKGIRSAKIYLIFSGLLLMLIIVGMGIWMAVNYASFVERMAGTTEILETSIQEKLSNLEKQVKSRTDELKMFSDRLLDLGSIVHETVEAQEISNLLNNSAEKISQRFGYSQVGIFLLDKSGQYIELKAEASASDQDQENRDSGLRRMGKLDKNYRLKVSDGKGPIYRVNHRDGENQGEG